jgi:hypothetical protein
MFNLVNRGELAGSTEHEFENLNARLKHLWLAEHNEDGTHISTLFSDVYAPIAHTHAATDITSGTLDDARLSSNIPLKNATNTFSALNTFSSGIKLTGTVAFTAGVLGMFLNTLSITGGTNGVQLVKSDGTTATWQVDDSGLQTLKAGIVFPATQVAAANANTLDDYEEGTFTPTLISSGGGTPTYNTQTGYYVKVGQLVWIYYRVILSSKAGFSAGTLSIGGLPFTANAGPLAGFVCPFWSALNTAMTYISAYMLASTTTGNITSITAAATNIGALSVADLTNTSDLIFAGCYRTST